MKIGTLGIAGVGLIGGSIGLAVRQRKLADKVIGIGRSPERLKTAIEAGAIDEYSLDLLGTASHCDMLYLAGPVLTIIEQLGQLNSIEGELIITDGGSTKHRIVSAGEGLRPNLRFVGGHPMTGSEQSGVEAASTTLYDGATYAITPTDQTNPEALNTVAAFAKGIGSEVVMVSPEEHDRAVASTSHLPHIIAGAFLRVAERSGSSASRLAAGSFRDLTRVSESPPGLWRDICITNKDAILRALADFRLSLSDIEAFLQAENIDEIERWFEVGKSIHGSYRQGKESDS